MVNIDKCVINIDNYNQHYFQYLYSQHNIIEYRYK